MANRFCTERMKPFLYHYQTLSMFCNQCKRRVVSKALVQENEGRESRDGKTSYKIFGRCEEKGHFWHIGYTRPLPIEKGYESNDDRTYEEQEWEDMQDVKEAEEALERDLDSTKKRIF